MATNESGSNGSWKTYLTLALWLVVQLVASAWWAATLSSDVKHLERELNAFRDKAEVLDIKYQVLDKEFAEYRAKKGN